MSMSFEEAAGTVVGGGVGGFHKDNLDFKKTARLFNKHRTLQVIQNG